jgi:mRNA interferase RelE/StbE
MKGIEGRYRLRVGDYRITYEKIENLLVIRIIEINSRGDIY